MMQDCSFLVFGAFSGTPGGRWIDFVHIKHCVYVVFVFAVKRGTLRKSSRGGEILIQVGCGPCEVFRSYLKRF